MKYEPTVPQEAAHRRIRDAVSLRVGRGKKHSVQGLSDAAGIPPRTIESYKDGSATPGLANFLSLCAALGPSFTSDVLSECGQTAKQSGDEEAEHMQVLAAACNFSGTIAEALSDDFIDHREKAALRPIAADLMEKLAPLARPDAEPRTSSVRNLGRVS